MEFLLQSSQVQKTIPSIKRYLRWSYYSLLVGLLAGGIASVFLILLDQATRTRQNHPGLVWFLPMAGFGVGWLYHLYGKNVAGGNNLILEEIHDPKNRVPLRMAPLVLLGTLITHLFGGSAGREGTIVQMGATLADQLSSIFKIEREERKILLVAGVGAAFGAGIGAPWAGWIFGMEVVHIGRLRFFAWFECLIASLVAYETTRFLHAPHSVYPRIGSISFDFYLLPKIFLLGMVCGIVALLFSKMTHVVESVLKKFDFYPPLKPFVGGIVLLIAYQGVSAAWYQGLGIEVIGNAFTYVMEGKVPLFKGFLTALTVGSGFKGGEFIPLVYIGATLGSSLSSMFHESLPLFAALGFVAVFAGAANTPLACTLMAMELFGSSIGLYALLVCMVSYHVSGHHGIYKSQKLFTPKYESFRFYLKYLGDLPARFLKP